MATSVRMCVGIWFGIAQLASRRPVPPIEVTFGELVVRASALPSEVSALGRGVQVMPSFDPNTRSRLRFIPV